MGFLQLDWNEIVQNLIYMTLAYAFAFPIGFNRERSARTAGLRTFPLVAVATCGYMLMGIQVLDSTDAEARAMVGVITGMGFIGGGAILKSKGGVTGTATAASLWNTGAIGMAVAWNRFEIALLLSLVNVATLQLLKPVKGLLGNEAAKEAEE